MNLVVQGAELVAGVVIFGCAVLAWDAMSRRTKHCWRFVYGLLGVAALALVLDPFFLADLASLARSGLVIGFAVHLALDRRRIRHHNDERAPGSSAPVVVLALICALLLPAVYVARPARAEEPRRVIHIHCDETACVIPFAIAKRLVDLWNRDAAGRGGCRGTAVSA